MTSPLGRYLRTHLAGSAAGVRLFERSGQHQSDPEIGSILLEICDQLEPERRYLQEAADRVGAGENLLLSSAAALAEKVGSLKPNGSLLHRTPMTDLVELEAMRIALSGKLAGWESLLQVVDDVEELDRDVLETFRDQAELQLQRVRDAHLIAARAALV